ncbi:uncharacterized protein BDW43DRAFT_311453 [Aspergillus alliaceus]|uniref:uncharacterized protein n=1 Tax=Petromyces alliaceus TaxID=209559 RepID=UPI0012A3C42F|nr:uncharacterized protein BDW43DRAFT_311453 [Aspergillus alliaceus]KAB8233042.1 hypothetical protein BDW43DRAFT_311453 [Aspergillus alliaceus]
MPNLSREALRKIASITPATKEALERIIERMTTIPPYSLQSPSGTAQSNYYPSETCITQEVVAAIAKAMERRLIEPENTRVRKTIRDGKAIYEVLQASVKTGVSTSYELDAGAILHSSFNYHGQY